jgi:hypothetical protein
MKHLIAFASLIVIISLAPFAIARAGDPFINSKWKVNLTTADSGAKDETDTITFKEAKFKSEVFEKRGFKPVAYEEDTRRGGLGGFTAEMTSEKEGKLKWTGTVTASEIRGDVVWTKPDGTTITYTYNGEKLPQK